MEPLNLEEELKAKGYSDKELNEAVREKKKDYAGLLTRGDALRLLARENGLELPEEKTAAAIDLSNAGEGAGFNARVIVEKAHCPREFESKERKGLVANAEIRQGETRAELVLWNKEAELASKGVVRRGARLLLENVSAKRNNGVLEVHTRYLTSVKAEGLDAPAPVPLPDLHGEDIVTEGIVTANSGLREFEKNGRKGRVCNLKVADGPAKAALVCWDYNALVASGFKLGDKVRVEGASYRGEELHAGRDAVIFKISSEPERLEKTPVASVKDGESAVVEAKIKSLFEAKETESGKIYLNGELEDSSGFKRFVAFDGKAFDLLGGKPAKVKPGTLLDIKRGYLLEMTAVLGVRGRKNDYNGEVELVIEEVGLIKD